MQYQATAGPQMYAVMPQLPRFALGAFGPWFPPRKFGREAAGTGVARPKVFPGLCQHLVGGRKDFPGASQCQGVPRKIFPGAAQYRVVPRKDFPGPDYPQVGPAKVFPGTFRRLAGAGAAPLRRERRRRAAGRPGRHRCGATPRPVLFGGFRGAPCPPRNRCRSGRCGPRRPRR